MSKAAKIRLFVKTPLATGNIVPLSEEQSRYLATVMRLETGDRILLFNGSDGEFAAELTMMGKKNAQATVAEQIRPFHAAKDIWLLFAPVKKDRTDFIIEKATELGVAKIIPVMTRYTITDKARIDRFQAQAIEAAEQSRRLDVPVIEEAVRLERLLSEWDPCRHLFFMDETGAGKPAISMFSEHLGPAAILVGPEGGFAEEELKSLRQQAFASAVSLGPLILRAETAVAAALSIWQSAGGYWDEDKK